MCRSVIQRFGPKFVFYETEVLDRELVKCCDESWVPICKTDNGILLFLFDLNNLYNPFKCRVNGIFVGIYKLYSLIHLYSLNK